MQAGDYEKARVVIERMLATVEGAEGSAEGPGDSAGSTMIQLALLEQGYRLHLHLGAPRRAQQLCEKAAELSQVRMVAASGPRRVVGCLTSTARSQALGDSSGVVAAQSAADLAHIMRGHPSRDGFTRAIDTGESAGNCSPFTLATAYRNRGALLFATRHQHQEDVLACFDKALDLLGSAAEATCASCGDCGDCADCTGEGCEGAGCGGTAQDGDGSSGMSVEVLGSQDPAAAQCRVVELSQASVRVAQGYCQTRLGVRAMRALLQRVVARCWPHLRVVGQMLDDAAETLTAALKTYEKWLDPDHPSLARSLIVMGALHHATQKVGARLGAARRGACGCAAGCCREPSSALTCGGVRGGNRP